MLAGVLVASALRGAPGWAQGPAGRDVVLRDADGGVAWTGSFRDALRPLKPRAYRTLGSCDQLGCDNRLMTGLLVRSPPPSRGAARHAVWLIAIDTGSTRPSSLGALFSAGPAAASPRNADKNLMCAGAPARGE